MIDTIATLNRFDIDAIKRKADYLAIFPGGHMIALLPSELKALAREVYKGVNWEGRTVKDIRDDVLGRSLNVMMRTIY